MKILKFTTFLESKEDRLNDILDKMNKNKELTNFEKDYLKKYNDLDDNDYEDYFHLSKDGLFDKVEYLLDDNIQILCEIDSNNIGYINSIHDRFVEEESYVELDNNKKLFIRDNYSYSLVFNTDKNYYQLNIQDKFYEKLPVSRNTNH